MDVMKGGISPCPTPRCCTDLQSTQATWMRLCDLTLPSDGDQQLGKCSRRLGNTPSSKACLETWCHMRHIAVASLQLGAATQLA